MAERRVKLTVMDVGSDGRDSEIEGRRGQTLRKTGKE